MAAVITTSNCFVAVAWMAAGTDCGKNSTSITYQHQADTAEVTRWFMMPEGKEYRAFRVIRYKTGKPETLEPVPLVTEYLAADSTIIAYKLMSLKAGYTYEITWFYK